MLELMIAHSPIIMQEVDYLSYNAISYTHIIFSGIVTGVHDIVNGTYHCIQNNFDPVVNQVKNLPSSTTTYTTTSTTMISITFLTVSSAINTAKDVSVILSPFTDRPLFSEELLYGEYGEKLDDLNNRIRSAYVWLKSFAFRQWNNGKSWLRSILIKKPKDPPPCGPEVI